MLSAVRVARCVHQTADDSQVRRVLPWPFRRTCSSAPARDDDVRAPDSAGVPESVTMLPSSRHNAADQVRAYVAANACGARRVIVEPVAANMGVVPPQRGSSWPWRETRAPAGRCSSSMR